MKDLMIKLLTHRTSQNHSAGFEWRASQVVKPHKLKHAAQSTRAAHHLTPGTSSWPATGCKTWVMNNDMLGGFLRKERAVFSDDDVRLLENRLVLHLSAG